MDYNFKYSEILPPLTKDEYAALKADIEQRGILVPVIVDEDKNVIDGQHRLMIADELELDYYPIEHVTTLDENEKQWLTIDLNLHRRHLSKKQRDEWILKLRDEQGFSTRLIAERIGTSQSTVQKTLHENDTEQKKSVAKPCIEMFVIGRDGKKRKAQTSDTTRVNARSNNIWYTPSEYIESAREVLGTIDLDPASSAEANITVNATLFFDEEQNGLDQEWHGKIWLNPPYGGMTVEFVSKLEAEYRKGNVTEAILLVNSNATDTNWFSPLWNHTLCFTNHRISFYSPQNTNATGSTHGSVFIYFGDNIPLFCNNFREYGAIVRQVNA